MTLGLYARMTTAPNSLMPRPHMSTAPDSTPRQACGKVTRENARRGEDPSVRATCSYRSSTRANASREPSTRKGRLTNSMASAMPATVSVKAMPSGAASRPTTPCRP